MVQQPDLYPGKSPGQISRRMWVRIPPGAFANVAQRQSFGFPNRWSWVRIPSFAFLGKAELHMNAELLVNTKDGTVYVSEGGKLHPLVQPGGQACAQPGCMPVWGRHLHSGRGCYVLRFATGSRRGAGASQGLPEAHRTDVPATPTS